MAHLVQGLSLHVPKALRFPVFSEQATADKPVRLNLAKKEPNLYTD